MEKPLAIKLRPEKITDMIGQEHLVGKDGVIKKLIKKKKIFSMIFYGPSGIGKTSLANVIVKELNLRYRELNAVINSKKDFDVVFEEAKLYNGIIIILDEIHRLNKDKQDLLLPHIENGLITLIGITSANPFHKINPAIRSRCQLFELYPLKKEDIEKGLKRIIKKNQIAIDNQAIKAIIKLANYDYRNAINTLELTTTINDNNEINVSAIEKIYNKPIILSDSNEDNYYDLLSALQKSIRGSDVDASLYYLARLIIQEDLEIIFRRLTVIAYEDIGLANPSLVARINQGINACERVGLPEAKIILSNLVIELAVSPKSNSAYLAIEKVINEIQKGKTYPIPKHLKNNSPDYKYPHNFKYSYVKQQYLPDEIKQKFYLPKNNKNETIFKTIINNLNK